MVSFVLNKYYTCNIIICTIIYSLFSFCHRPPTYTTGSSKIIGLSNCAKLIPTLIIETRKGLSNLTCAELSRALSHPRPVAVSSPCLSILIKHYINTLSSLITSCTSLATNWVLTSLCSHLHSHKTFPFFLKD